MAAVSCLLDTDPVGDVLREGETVFVDAVVGGKLFLGSEWSGEASVDATPAEVVPTPTPTPASHRAPTPTPTTARATDDEDEDDEDEEQAASDDDEDAGEEDEDDPPLDQGVDSANAKAAATSLEHIMTHLPKDAHCSACQRAKNG